MFDLYFLKLREQIDGAQKEGGRERGDTGERK